MSVGAASLYWIMPGLLAGMPMPFIHPSRRLNRGGALAEFEDELPELQGAGIRGIVSLLNIPSDAEVWRSAGFAFLCLPVPDGMPPTPEQVANFVEFVDSCHRGGGAVAVHCEAGLGRTGTLLAAYLVAKGESASLAVHRVRSVEPSAIETHAQIAFLHHLEASRSEGPTH
jgi:hypothetical protein